MRHLTAAVSHALFCVAIAASAWAHPEAVGPEFAANQYPAPPVDDSACTDENGITVELRYERNDDGLFVFALRLDANGDPIGERQAVNDEAADPSYSSVVRLACRDDGTFAVSWSDRDSDCGLLRVFDASGSPVGLPSRLASGSAPSCTAIYVTELAAAPGGFAALWRNRGSVAGYALRRYDASGKPLAEEALVATGDDLAYGAQVAFDADGAALLVWASTVYEYFLDLDARAVAADGTVLDPIVTVSARAPRTRAWNAVASSAPGVFLVRWYDWAAGGWMGRWVNIDPVRFAAPTTTTTTLPPSDDFPELLGPQFVYGPVEWVFREPHDPLIGTDGHGGWVSSWQCIGEQDCYSGADISRSASDGRVWSAPHSSRRIALASDMATDGKGNWLLVGAAWERRITADRSTDGGRSWQDFSQDETGVWAPQDYPFQRIEGSCSAIATDGAGVWLLAHGLAEVTNRSDYDDDRYLSYEDWRAAPKTRRIQVLRSTDAGASWSVAGAADEDSPSVAMDLATDRRGTWVLVWQQEDELRASTSSDRGASWSAPTAVAAGSGADSRWNDGGVSLATDEQGRWVVAWRSRRSMADRYGADVDVFASYSTDAGLTWSAPVAANIYAAVDGVDDGAPTLATDRDGRWIVAWSSHDPLGGSIGRDADIIAAISTDGAVTWSAPVPVDAAAREDASDDSAPRLVADARGRWGIVWLREEPDTPTYDFYTTGILFARSPDECGNGAVEPPELCDDGNSTDGDGCDSDCTATACGNAIVTAGEQCDDGNGDDNDACLANCKAAVCGDGTVRRGVEACDDANDSDFDDCLNDCRRASCGDGVLHAGVEQCDDGNDDDTDACLKNCRTARCGDHVVHAGVEECDPGYFTATGECTPECTLAVCGDGLVRAQVEQCDDGNDDDGDACSNDCRIQRNCGDGVVQFGLEQCDDGNDDETDACSSECTPLPRCGDANNDTNISASDASYVLEAAIGIPRYCPLRACDIDGDRGVAADDALGILKLSVGDAVEPRCSVTDQIVFHVDGDRSLGALQFEAEFAPGAGTFAGSYGAAECESLVPGAFVAVQIDAEGALMVGIMSLSPMTPPLDLLRCDVLPFVAGSIAAVSVDVLDAAGTDLDSVLPPPVVSAR